MQKFPDRMHDILSKTTDDEIDRIVVNPPNVISKRNTLKRKVDTLEKGIVALRELF
jgi:methylase of polypeptide subunit release factors